jgi:hypothetical protein
MMVKRKAGRVSRAVDRVAEWLFPDPDAELMAELKSLVNGDEGSPGKKTPPKG